MGIGYSAWQEQLTVNSTVVTGDLRLDFETAEIDISQVYPDKKTTNPDNITDDYKIANGIEDKLLNDDESILSFLALGLSPGEQVYHTVDIINNGTIPAIIQDLEIDLLDIGVETDYIKMDFLLYDNISIPSSSIPISIDTLKNKSKHFKSNKSFYNGKFDNNPILPGERWTLVFGILLDESITDDQVDEKLKVEFDIKFNGEQYK